MSQNPHQHFNALSIEGISVLETLLDSLVKEREALGERNLEAMQACTSEKRVTLLNFEENIAKRNQLLSEQGFESSKEGVAMFLASCRDGALKAQSTENWEKLETQLKATIDANSANEQILNRNHKNLSAVLSILQGKSAANVLYNAKGDKGDYSGQSRIGKA